MKRPWQIWLLFTACVLAAAAGMAWLTQQALRADEQRRSAQSEAELEQRVSLALWRMDTELAPILAEEVIRPPSAFRPSNTGSVKPPQYVLLQFEARDQGFWWSPQVGVWKSYVPQMDELSKSIDVSHLLAQLPGTPLPTASIVEKNPWGPLTQQQVDKSVEAPQFIAGNSLNPPAQEPAQQLEQPTAKPTQTAQAEDFQQRSKRYQSAAQQSLLNFEQRQATSAPPAAKPSLPQSKTTQKPPEELVGVSRPVWIGDRLILARRVSVGGETRVQGSLLDWPQLKARLLTEASGLLPKADLVPVNGDAASDPSRMLAGLPVRLVVGETASPSTVGSTLRWALMIGWGAVLLAVGAAALLLAGVITLSERRAAFVSSVTHELRTPLTTFRMYAEMLAKGMVPEASRRQEYFNTLQREAERLTLLVENVLAYARLERGRRPMAKDEITIASLLERVAPRLLQHAEQAGMTCEISCDAVAAHTKITTDQAVVEQIVFNLVDNASKYARNAADRRIHVVASAKGEPLSIRVVDHGPGFSSGAAKGRQPFQKSAQESADTAPGVGLGLALCRRLARQLGGRLEISTANSDGASVSLLLPVS